MENKKFNEFCNSINYDTYINLRRISAILGGGLSIVESSIPLLSRSIDYASYSLLGIFSYMLFKRGEKNTKNINEIKDLYQKFINNYNEINRLFDFNEPLQIFAMFDYLLYQGYLSKDKKFQFSNQEVKDLDTMFGTNILMGNGVCRHIVALLIDILKNYGIDAYYLGCYSKSGSLNIDVVNEEIMCKEEQLKWINKYIKRDIDKDYIYGLLKMYEEIGLYANLSYQNVDSKSSFERLFGNHVICYVNKDNKDYFWDPTFSKIYNFKDRDNGVMGDYFETIKLKMVGTILFNSIQDYISIKRKIDNEFSQNIEESYKIIDNTKEICKNNLDIFERFYLDNCEIYEDVTDKLMKIKKRLLVL